MVEDRRLSPVGRREGSDDFCGDGFENERDTVALDHVRGLRGSTDFLSKGFHPFDTPRFEEPNCNVGLVCDEG